jgi:hypothetical protein
MIRDYFSKVEKKLDEIKINLPIQNSEEPKKKSIGVRGMFDEEAEKGKGFYYRAL